jgi:glycosyltransferase involved in cell wall biosynthesis
VNNTRPSKRVLVVDCVVTTGGGQRVFADMVSSLLEQGWQVAAMVAENSYLTSLPLSKNVEMVFVPRLIRYPGHQARLLRNMQYGFHLWKHRRQMCDSDFCIINDPDVFIPAVLLSRWLGKRNLVLYAHFVYFGLQLKIMSFIARQRSVLQVWCASEFLSQYLALNGLNGKVFSLAPACRLDVTPPSLMAMPRSFASIGLIHPYKGHEVLFYLAARYPHQLFHVIGPEDISQSAYSRLLRKTAPANILFSGFVSDIRAYCSQNNIGGILVASRDDHEAFGLTALESVALGLGTVVRRTGGLTEIANRLGLHSAQDDAGLVLEACKIVESADLIALITQQQLRLLSYFTKRGFTLRLRELIEKLHMKNT